MSEPHELKDLLVERADPTNFVIQHVGEGHSYTFHVAMDQGRQILSTAYSVREKPTANHSAEYFIDSVRPFAEHEARARDWID